MKLFDQNGEYPVADNLVPISLQEKLANMMALARRINDRADKEPILVYLEPKEEEEFKLSCERIWGIKSDDITGLKNALGKISDEINSNHTNGVGRFIPVSILTESPEPVSFKTTFGWQYIKSPLPFKLPKGGKVSVSF